MREAFRIHQNRLIEYLDENNIQLNVSFGTVGASMPDYNKVNKAINKAINTIIKQLESKRSIGNSND